MKPSLVKIACVAPLRVSMTSRDVLDSPPRRFRLIVLMSGVAFGMTAPLTSLFAKTFWPSDIAAGFAVASISIVLIAVDVLGTDFIPHLDARCAIWLSLTIFGTFSCVSAFAPDYWTMVGARICQGVGGALMMGGALQLAVRGVPPRRAGRAMGSFNAALFAGIAIGPLVGGTTSRIAGGGQLGMRAAFAMCGAVSLATALACRLSLPALPSQQSPRVGWPRLHLRHRKLRGSLALGMFGQALRGGVAFTILPLFAAERLGLSTLGVAISLSAVSATDVASMGVLGSLADRRGRRPVLVGAIAVGVLGAALTASTRAIVPFFICCALLGTAIGTSTVVPAAMVVDCSEDTVAALSAYRIFSDVGAVVGSLGAGVVIAGGGIGAGLRWATAMLIAAALGVLWLGETAPRKELAHHAEVRFPVRPDRSS